MSRAARLALCGAWLGVCALGCTEEAGQQRGPGGRGGPPAAPAPAVAVAPVLIEPVEERLPGHAALEAEAIVDLGVRVEGRVIELSAEAGDRVAKGQILARLDETRPALSLEIAEVALRQAKSALARTEQIVGEGLASAEELDLARTALEQAQLGLTQARLDLAESSLRSPLAGVVTLRQAALGQTLRPGEVAFQIADRDPLLARVRIPEAQAERVHVGQEARVRVEGRSETLRGRVERIAPVVDLESGTVVVTVSLREGVDGLRLNRFATVEIVVARRERALTIPLDALAVRGRDDRILVCKADAQGSGGTVELRPIKVGARQEGRIEVLEGLAAGELVVVAAPDDLRSGSKVRVVPLGGSEREAGVAAPSSARRVGSPTRGR